MTTANCTITYQLMHNIDRDKWDGYRTGDHVLADGYLGEIEYELLPLGEGRATGRLPMSPTLEAIFSRHNRDDRPDGQDAPSLSVGDVIVLEPEGLGWAYAVEREGFRGTVIELAARAGLTYRELFIDR